MNWGPCRTPSRIARPGSLLGDLAAATLLRRALSRREDHIATPLFSGNLSPAETNLGESSVSGLRTRQSKILSSGISPGRQA